MAIALPTRRRHDQSKMKTDTRLPGIRVCFFNAESINDLFLIAGSLGPGQHD
jgi:hypothetical protein